MVVPELPEVETTARALRGVLPGRMFTRVLVGWPPMVQKSALDVVQCLPGQRIQEIGRRGKYLLFALSKGNTLVMHLKMSGRLYVCAENEAPDLYDRATFFLDDERTLRFRDPRKFGRVYLVDNLAGLLGRLGPEPLNDGFEEQEFLALFGKRHGTIKPLLLDQTFIAGIGNIYADESLFLARILPYRRSDTLTDAEKRRLYQAIRQVLTRAIELNGSTLADGTFHGGNFQNHFCVYSREAQPCPACGNPIQRIKLGQRSSYFCPRCQS
jgi:formamidopyrimidine-DNA glycosylase